MSSIDQQFVEFIVKSLVSKPDAVQVERRIDEKGVLLELTVDPEDLGRVIGKRGATAQSLRTLLRALGTKNDARYNLKIIDNGEGAGSYAPSSAPTTDVTDSAADDTTTAPASTPTATQDEDDTDDTYGEAKPADQAPDPSSMASKTRKELEELDDLDV